MVQELPDLTEAVNKPDVLTLPHDADQVTAALALNCCVIPAGVAALAGVITNGVVTVAVVEARMPLAAFAVTVHGPVFSGAV
jgi:hypothetical protein